MTAHAAGTAARLPTGAFWQLVKFEGRMAIREPAGIIFGLALPVFLLAVFASIPGFGSHTVPGTHLTDFEVYLPILMCTVLLMVTLIGLPIPLARDREIGWLRRFSTTPAKPSLLLGAQVIVNLLLALAAICILFVGGVLIFKIGAPIQVGGFLLAIGLATCALFSMGLLVAAVAPSEKSAGAIAQGLLYPLLFFAGVYLPTEYLPRYLQTISNLSPVGAARQAMTDAMQGSFPSLLALGVSAVYAVVLSVLAIRLFRWE